MSVNSCVKVWPFLATYTDKCFHGIKVIPNSYLHQLATLNRVWVGTNFSIVIWQFSKGQAFPFCIILNCSNNLTILTWAEQNWIHQLLTYDRLILVKSNLVLPEQQHSCANSLYSPALYISSQDPCWSILGCVHCYTCIHINEWFIRSSYFTPVAVWEPSLSYEIASNWIFHQPHFSWFEWYCHFLANWMWRQLLCKLLPSNFLVNLNWACVAAGEGIVDPIWYFAKL